MSPTSNQGGFNERAKRKLEEERKLIESSRERQESLISSELQQHGESASNCRQKRAGCYQERFAGSPQCPEGAAASRSGRDAQASGHNVAEGVDVTAGDRDRSLAEHLDGELGAGTVAVVPDPEASGDRGLPENPQIVEQLGLEAAAACDLLYRGEPESHQQPPQPPSAQGDRGQYRRALTNAIGAACTLVAEAELHTGSASGRRSHQRPVARERVSQGFCKRKHEFTQGQW